MSHDYFNLSLVGEPIQATPSGEIGSLTRQVLLTPANLARHMSGGRPLDDVMDGQVRRSGAGSDQTPVADDSATEWPARFRELLLKKTMEAQEAERRRIARDIHDESEQLLGNAIFRLDMCMMQRPEVGETAKKDLAKIRAILIETVQGLQNLAHSLRPSLLDDLGLEASLAWFFRTSGCNERLNVRSRVASQKGRLPSAVETAVFRIVQEACSNVLKHAQARNLSVGIRIVASRVIVIVRDDGAGLDPRALQRNLLAGDGSIHMGLSGMRERAELLGGRFSLHSRPQRGTRIAVVIPLRRQTEERTK